MNPPATDRIDLVFELNGEILPVAYQLALWEEIIRLAPLLAMTEEVGIVPLRGSESAEGMLLPKRARLVLRLPQELLEAASPLAEQQMQVGGNALRLGAGKPRALQPSPTLHAHLVASSLEEVEFVDWVETELTAMQVKAKLICGQRRTLDAGTSIRGYSLVLHDLAAEDSLRVQQAGLGPWRRFGCGIFMPHKAISGLE